MQRLIMNILTEYNVPYSINNIDLEAPIVDDQTQDIMFCVIDYTNPKTADYMFYPLLFLESFYAPSIELLINGKSISFPMDWSIVIGDKHSGELEVFQIKKIIDRDFQAFSINPISGLCQIFLI